MKRTTSIALLAATLTAGALAVIAATPPPNLPQALAVQRQLVSERPGDAAAHNDLGNLLLLSGDAAGAEESYRQAVALAPDRAAYHYNLGLLLQQRGALREARKAYLQVVRLEPANAWVHFHLGSIAEQRGQERRAIERYGEAFRLDPNLAFPDVNPAVIDSDLITEAMLHGYRESAAGPQAPRVYADRARITALLLPSPPADTPVVPVTATPQEDLPRDVQTGPGGQRGAGSASMIPPRVLDDDDLGTGTVNQAEPGGDGGARYRPPARERGAARERTQVRTWNQPGILGSPSPDETPEGRPTGAVPGAPRGRDLVPTLPSTGRLEMHLRGERTAEEREG